MDSTKTKNTHNSPKYVVSETVENGGEKVKVCHQCGNWSGSVRLIDCENCKSNTYCFDCFTKWYPNVPEEKFVKACPVCCNNCNCKTCVKHVKDLSVGTDGFLSVEVPEIVNDTEMNVGSNTNGWLSDDSLENKNDMSPNKEPVSAAIEDSGSSVPTLEMWQGLAVRREVKELLQCIEQCYPSTFQRLILRSPCLWLPILNQFYVVMKRFTDSSVDSLTEDRITTLHEDLKEYEKINFDLSWAHRRLDMVKQLKFGNEPLQNELFVLESSLKPLEESVEERRKVYLEAHEKLKETQLEYNGVADALNKIRLAMEEKFGADYEQVLNGQLGLGLLPPY